MPPERASGTCDRIIFFCLALFAFTSSFSIFLSNFFFYSAIAAYAFSYFTRRSPFHFSRIYTLMMLYAAANVIAFFAGGNGFSDIGRIKNLMCFLGFLIAYEKGSELLDKTFMMLLIQGASAALLILAITLHAAGLSNLYLFQDFANWTHQYSGLFSISITYAEFLVMAQIISISILLFARDSFGGRLRRGLFTAFIAVDFVALVLTYARGPWLAMAVALVAIFFKLSRKVALASAVVIALAFAFLVSPASEGLPLVGDVHQRVAMTLSGYSSGREVIYAVGMNIVRDHPVFGVGIGGVERLYPEYLKALPGVPENQKKMLLKQHMTFGHLHNAYLQIWAETGLFGLTIFLALLFYAAARIASGRPGAESSPLDSAFRFGALTSLVAMCIMGLTEYNFFHNEISRIFWFYIGMAVAAANGRVPPAAADGCAREIES